MNHKILYCLEDNPVCIMNNLIKKQPEEEYEVTIINYLNKPKFKSWNRLEVYYENQIRIQYYEINMEKAKKKINKKYTYLSIEKYSLDFLKAIIEKNA